MTGPDDWVIMVCPPGAETASSPDEAARNSASHAAPTFTSKPLDQPRPQNAIHPAGDRARLRWARPPRRLPDRALEVVGRGFPEPSRQTL